MRSLASLAVSVLALATFGALSSGHSDAAIRCGGQVATIVGSGVILGTPGDDVIVGSGDDDHIEAGAGNDIVCAGPGNDIVDAGPGDDVVRGGRGSDRLVGDDGNDVLRGMHGADEVIGGRGNDLLAGHRGPDVLVGGPGDDLMRGGPNADHLDGARGWDRATGGQASDVCLESEVLARCAHPQRIYAVALGDFGHPEGEEYAVAGRIEGLAADTPLDVMLTTGDNLYTDDVEAAWSVPYGWTAGSISVWPAWGNHDVESPTRVAAHDEAFGVVEPWYRRELGGAVMLVLDSNQVTHPDQLAWLDAQLAGLGDRFVIAAFHHPLASCSRHGAEPDVVEHWLPRLSDGGVDLVLTGHDHNYQHFEREGITAVVTGGGGRVPLYSLDPCPEGHPDRLAGAERHHFVRLAIGKDRVRLWVIAVDGEVLDRHVLDR